MFLRLLSLSLWFLSGCASWFPSSRPDPWVRGEKKPTRVLVLLFEGLDPSSGDLQQLPHFQRLKTRALSFNEAWVGHLFATPAVSHLVINSGLAPRHLPWDDVIVKDRVEALGQRKRPFLIDELSTPQLSQLLSPVSLSLFKQIPGTATTKLGLAPKPAEAYSLASPGNQSRVLSGSPSPDQSEESWVAHEVLSFFKAEPDWKVALAFFGSSLSNPFKVDEQLGRILTYLEEKNLLSETVIVVSSHPVSPLNSAKQVVFVEGKTPLQSLPADLKALLRGGNVLTAVKDSSLRFHLRKKGEIEILRFSSLLKTFPGVLEIHYKKEISGRFHYIKTFRSPRLEGSALEWAKNQAPTLLQSLASRHSPDVLAFLAPEPQAVPLLIWSPNLRFDNPVIKNQIEQTRIRFVDIHPVILELMGLPLESGLDGTPLGIRSLIY